MSKYLTIKTEFLSETALRQALEDACGEFGIAYEYHPEGAHLYGVGGNLRPEKAEYIIRRRYVGGLANDMGFARQPDGSFAAIISEYDSRSNWAGGQRKLDFITWRYQYNQVQEYAMTNGFTVIETETPEGVRLELERAW